MCQFRKSCLIAEFLWAHFWILKKPVVDFKPLDFSDTQPCSAGDNKSLTSRCLEVTFLILVLEIHLTVTVIVTSLPLLGSVGSAVVRRYVKESSPMNPLLD